MTKVYIVQIQGWGDSEDEFYNMGTYSTRSKAEAALEDVVNVVSLTIGIVGLIKSFG